MCSFCNNEDETLEHLFFQCPVSQSFWTDINNWILLKINDVPSFELHHIVYYMDDLVLFSEVINIILLLGKYHIHCAKWRSCKPSFPGFINEFKMFFLSLKKVQPSKIVSKICSDIAQNLLF